MQVSLAGQPLTPTTAGDRIQVNISSNTQSIWEDMMSLIVAVYVPEAIVMSSDSRQSITIEGKQPSGEVFKIETVNSDAVTKTHCLEHQQVGISNFGQDLLKGVPISSYIQSFIEEELVSADDVTTIPDKLVSYFRVKKQFPDADIGFHVAGYKKENKVSVPYVFYCHIAKAEVIRRNAKPDGSLSYGAAWSGQIDILQSIVSPVSIKDSRGKESIVRTTAPIIWDAMTVQDAIDFAVYAIRTTIDTMRFQARAKNVGGNIDVLLLTPNQKPEWLKKKEYRAP